MVRFVSRSARIGSPLSLLVGAVLLNGAAGALAAGTMLGPADLSGFLSYDYRALSENDGADRVSHLVSGTVKTATYLWQPWLATTDLSLTLTQDSSSYDNAQISDSTSSQILTGNLGLNLFPRSKAPFTARLQRYDSRINRERVGGAPITFTGVDYSATYLSLKQVYMKESGDRYQARLDLNSWDSSSGSRYDEQSLGLDVDVRRAGQRFTVRGGYDVTDYSDSDRKNKSLVMDVTHNYYPKRHFRLDSKVTVYDYDRSFLDPSSDDTRLSQTSIVQASSFAFWRPQNSKWTISGGARVSTTRGTEEGVSNYPGSGADSDQTQLSVNAGMFYQASQYLRFDGNASYTQQSLDSSEAADSVSNRYVRSRLGMLYSSKWYHFSDFMYQWYGDGSLEFNVDPVTTTQYLDAGVGHNLNRTWWPVERTTPGSLRFNFNQAVIFSAASGEYKLDNPLEASIYERDLTAHKLNHSASLAFDSKFWNGDMLAQLTLSDSREVGDLDSAYQLINFQFNSTQRLGGKSSLSGNVTLQQVLSEYDEVIRYSGFDAATNQNVVPGQVVTRKRDTITGTASLRFEHSRMFGVPRLRFHSNFMISQISTEGAVDRQDWDSALSYSIGKLETSLSYRLTDTDGRNYDLLYFRVMRRF